METSPAPRSGCPINQAVEVLGDPWAVLVLRDIMFGNRRHFRELRADSDEDPHAPRASDRLRSAYQAAMRNPSDPA